MQLIGMAGYARSGKDTAADALTGIGFRRVAFADKLREFMYALNPQVLMNDNPRWSASLSLRSVIDHHGWDGYKTSNCSNYIRMLMQHVGTECVRDILGEDIWLNFVLNGLDINEDYVITDVRFPNEVEAIRRMGGRVIYVMRPGIVPSNNHASDTTFNPMRDSDYIVRNDSSIEALHESVLAAVKY
jgi:hypothetical protein